MEKNGGKRSNTKDSRLGFPAFFVHLYIHWKLPIVMSDTLCAVRKLSERIMKRSGFSKFKNTRENPLSFDEDGNIIEESKLKLRAGIKSSVKKVVGDNSEGVCSNCLFLHISYAEFYSNCL